MVPSSLGPPQILQRPEFAGVARCQVVGLRKVLVDVVKFPLGLIDVETGAIGLPWRERKGGGKPTVLVNAAVDADLKHLRLVALGRIPIAERIGDADALDGFLSDSIEDIRRLQTGYLQDGGHDVDDMVELSAQAAFFCDLGRPGDKHRITRAAEMRSDLLRPLEGRVHRPGPGRREMVEMLGTAELVDNLDVVLPSRQDVVEEGILVSRAFNATFGRGAIVADDIDDHGVVGVGKLGDRFEHAAHLVIDVSAVTREYLHHARIETLLLPTKGLPGRQARGARCELCVRRDHAKLLLPLERDFTIAVPTHVELTFELVDPLAWRLVRRMSRGGSDIEEERAIGVDDLHLLHPGDRLVGDVGGEMIVGVTRARHAVAVFIEDRLVLARIAGVEAIEIVEAEPIGPTIKGTDFAGLPDWRVVVLANPCRGVTVLS